MDLLALKTLPAVRPVLVIYQFYIGPTAGKFGSVGIGSWVKGNPSRL